MAPWTVLFGGAQGGGPIEEDDPPIHLSVAAWDSLRDAISNPYVVDALNAALRTGPLVAISSKAASSCAIDVACLRFHFQGERGASTLRVYSHAEGSVWQAGPVHIREGEKPLRQGDGLVAGDSQALNAFIAVVSHPNFDAWVRPLLPQFALCTISLDASSTDPEASRVFTFSFGFESIGGCRTSPVELVAEFFHNPTGGSRMTSMRRVEGGQAHG